MLIYYQSNGGAVDKRLTWSKKKKNVYYVNEDFFKHWSSTMAYVLGFFAADGCLTINRKRGNKYIEFVSTDKEIIVKIKKCLNAKQKISIKSQNNPKWNKAYRIQIGSKNIFEDLCKLGFMPKKSLVVKFPKIPSGYLSHFIRGYFDGDGHCSFCRFKRKDRPSHGKIILSGFTSGSAEFLKILKSKLERHAIIIGGTLCFHGGCRLTYATANSQKLYKFMYRDIDQIIYLRRKYLTFQKAFQQYGPVV